MTNDAKTNYQSAVVAGNYDRTRFSGFKGRLFAYLQLRSFKTLLKAADANTVLDVPCGTGRILEALPHYKHRIIGVDISPSMLSIARKKLDKLNLPYPLMIMDADNLAFKDNAIDCISSLKFFHLLPPTIQRIAIGEFRRVANKTLILSIPVVEKRDYESTDAKTNRVKLFRKKHFIRELRKRLQIDGLEIMDLRYTLRFLSNDSVVLMRKVDDRSR